MTPKLRTSLLSEYYRIDTRLGTLHVHIDFDDAGPKRIFSQIPPVGSDLANNTAFIGIMLTKYLQAGGDAQGILKHLFSVRGTAIGEWEGHTIESIPYAIGIALQTHLRRHSKAEPTPELDRTLVAV